MTFLDSIPFDRLLWLVPVFLAIHNIEEAPFMENWSKRLPLRMPVTITTRQFVMAVTFLTLAAFVITYFCVEYVANPLGYLIVLGIQVIMLFNTFVPHIATTIRFRLYSLGAMTAILINLPFSYYQYFTKTKRFPENRGAGVHPHPCFRASFDSFVIY